MAQTDKTIRETVVVGPDCREQILLMQTPALAYLQHQGIGFSGLGLERGEYEIRRSSYAPHLLLYTLEGAGWLDTGKGRVLLSPGSVFISPQGVGHHYGLKRSFWRIAWVSLEDRPPWTVLQGLKPQVRPSTVGARVYATVAALIQEQESADPKKERAIQLLSELLVLSLERELAVQPAQGSTVAARLHGLQTDVCAQLQYPWSVESLAKSSGLFVSADRFSRLCLQHLGQPPMQWVTRLRMQRAAELLRTTDYAVRHVARLIGYENAFAFSTAFRNFQGSSPRQFRVRLQARDPGEGPRGR